MVPLIRNAKDFWAGLIYLFVGGAAIIIARDYGMGTATRMGPGYFPVILGAFLAGIGIIALVRSFLGARQRVGIFALRGLALVFVATVLFAVLLRGAGLVIALMALAIVGAYSSMKFHAGRSFVLAVGLVVFCVVVFVKGLGVPLPLLGSWFGD